MPTKRDVITNPFVSEYIYDCVVNATVEQRKYLNGKLLRVGKNIRKARAFSVNSTLEDKALMLAKLGIPFAWVFNIDKEKLKELKETVGEMSNVHITDMMLKEKYFVITDKQFLLFAGLMAGNTHSETWMMNRDFLRAGYALKEWRQEYGNVPLQDSKDAISAARSLAKIMMNTIIFSKYAEGAFDLNEPEAAVLFYFFSKEREYITLSELRVCFNGVYRNFKLVMALNQLMKAKFIEKGEGKYKGQFRMTGWGVDIALKFQKKVLSLENY